MPIVQIAPVSRQGMRLLISLYGLSETGKTYSAIQLMGGIEPDPAKRGLLDSEGGERGRAYFDAIPGGFMYGALRPPFTPERYTEALQDFVAAGVTTLTVDSVSHAWFAEGGVLDMVENASEKNDMAKWAKPKRRLGKMTDKMLGCGLNLILCSRAKQPLLEDVGPTGKKIYTPGPITPIQEKSLRYDMTIMALMTGDGHFTVNRADGGKCPGALRPIFAAGEVMDVTMGQKLMEWIGGADATSPDQRKLLMEAEDVAGLGSDEFRKWWNDKGQRTATQREFLRASLDNLQSIAKAADTEAARQRAAKEGAERQDDREDPFATGAALPNGVQRVGADLGPHPMAEASQ